MTPLRCANCGARVHGGELRAHLASQACQERAQAIQAARRAPIDREAELAAIEAATITRVPPGVSGATDDFALRGRFNSMDWACPVCGDEMPAGQRKAHETEGCVPPGPSTGRAKHTARTMRGKERETGAADGAWRA